jgi:hypothetical protein
LVLQEYIATIDAPGRPKVPDCETIGLIPLKKKGFHRYRFDNMGCAITMVVPSGGIASMDIDDPWKTALPNLENLS